MLIAQVGTDEDLTTGGDNYDTKRIDRMAATNKATIILREVEVREL